MRQNTAVPVVAAKSNPHYITHRDPNLGMEREEHSARCGSQMEPASHQKWNPKGAKMEAKCSQNGVQIEPKWSPMGSKFGPDTPKFEKKCKICRKQLDFHLLSETLFPILGSLLHVLLWR